LLAPSRRLLRYGQQPEVSCSFLPSIPNKIRQRDRFDAINAGQYHWVHALAPPSQKRVASWFTGWISIGGQTVLTASAAFASGLQFQALITLNNMDTYVPARWQGMLFYWLVLVYSCAVNIWGSRVLPHTNLASGIFFLSALSHLTFYTC
jgi:hypothetical protein